jgi:hypothetical protein
MVLSCVPGSARELATGFFVLYHTCDGSNIRTSTRGIVGTWRKYKEKKGWWGAIVTKTSRRTLTTSPQSTMIRYDATDSNVIFINSTVLEESNGRTKYVRHLWRWIETTGRESGRNGISMSTAQPADVFNPDDVHNAVNIELTGAGEYSGLYSAILQRVETL